jgi:hypothetical protein
LKFPTGSTHSTANEDRGDLHVTSVRGLMSRLIGGYSAKFELEVIEPADGKDVFEVRPWM